LHGSNEEGWLTPRAAAELVESALIVRHGGGPEVVKGEWAVQWFSNQQEGQRMRTKAVEVVAISWPENTANLGKGEPYSYA
jgi:hypothetical protein